MTLWGEGSGWVPAFRDSTASYEKHVAFLVMIKIIQTTRQLKSLLETVLKVREKGNLVEVSLTNKAPKTVLKDMLNFRGKGRMGELLVWGSSCL